MTTITTTNLTLNNVCPKNGGNYSVPSGIYNAQQGYCCLLIFFVTLKLTIVFCF